MDREVLKGNEPDIAPEHAYLHQISASALHVMKSLKANKVKPDTILMVSTGEMQLPGTHFYTYSSSKKESWKVTENTRPSLNSKTGLKVGFVLTELGELLDYVDRGTGPVHSTEYPLLPIIKNGEIEQSNIMKNDIILGLGELCIRNNINPIVIEIN